MGEVVEEEHWLALFWRTCLNSRILLVAVGAGAGAGAVVWAVVVLQRTGAAGGLRHRGRGEPVFLFGPTAYAAAGEYIS